jgi:hypothetical protein
MPRAAGGAWPGHHRSAPPAQHAELGAQRHRAGVLAEVAAGRLAASHHALDAQAVTWARDSMSCRTNPSGSGHGKRGSAVRRLTVAPGSWPGIARRRPNSSEPLRYGAALWAVAAVGFTIIASAPLSWGIGADYARYLPADTSWRAVVGWTALGGFLPAVLLAGLGCSSPAWGAARHGSGHDRPAGVTEGSPARLVSAWAASQVPT